MCSPLLRELLKILVTLSVVSYGFVSSNIDDKRNFLNFNEVNFPFFRFLLLFYGDSPRATSFGFKFLNLVGC